MEMRSLAADLRLQFQPVTLDVGLISFVCLQETKARGQVYIWRAAGGLLTCNFRGKKTIRLLCGFFLSFFFHVRRGTILSSEQAIENLTSVPLDNAQTNNEVERLREENLCEHDERSSSSLLRAGGGKAKSHIWNDSQAAGVNSHVHVGKSSVKTFGKRRPRELLKTEL